MKKLEDAAIPVDRHSSTAESSMRTDSSVWLDGGEPQPGRIARAQYRSIADFSKVADLDPKTLLPSLSIYGCLRSAAELEPDKPAIVHLLSAKPEIAPRTISYRQLVEKIEQSANLFFGISEGEPTAVGIVLPMIPEALMASWGAATAGIAVPINPFLELKHAISILNTAKATVLVTCGPGYGDGLWNKFEEIKAKVPTLRAVFFVNADDGKQDFIQALAGQTSGSLNFNRQHDQDTEAYYLPTGGTTAAPKLVRMTHYGQLVNAFNMASLLGSSRDEVSAHALPLFHVGGLVTICLRSLIYGQTVVTLTTEGYRNPDVIRNFWSLAKQYGLTNVVVTPTTAAAILANENTPPGGHKLTKIFCGGAAVPIDLAMRFQQQLGVSLREFWGMSEVYGCVTGQPDDGKPAVAGSVGHVLPFHQLKAVVVDGDGQYLRDCAPNERGVLAVSGVAVVPGYAEQQFDKGLFFTSSADGKTWINTGDLGSVDDNDFVWLYGRVKDVIIRGGHNIDPAMIEEVIVGHPSVQLSAAIGRPDRTRGELPMLYVQIKDGTTVKTEELLDYCQRHMQERAAIPVEIVILEKMPLTPVGKVFKPSLRVDAINRVSQRLADDVAPTNQKVQVRVDESGRRPRVVLTISDDYTDASTLQKNLKTAFSGFEFLCDVEKS